MLFVPQKTVKGQTLADFLAAHPVPESSKLHKEIPDEVFCGAPIWRGRHCDIHTQGDGIITYVR